MSEKKSFLEEFSQHVLMRALGEPLSVCATISGFCYSFFCRQGKVFRSVAKFGYSNSSFQYLFLKENPKLLNDILVSNFKKLPHKVQGFLKNAEIFAVVDNKDAPKSILISEFSLELYQALAKSSSPQLVVEQILRILLAFCMQGARVSQQNIRAGNPYLPIWLEKIYNETAVEHLDFLFIVAESGSGQEQLIRRILMKRNNRLDNVHFFYPGRLSAEVQLRELFGDPAGVRLGGDAGVLGLVNQRENISIVIREVSHLCAVAQKRLFSYLSSHQQRMFWVLETTRDLRKLVAANHFYEPLLLHIEKNRIVLPPLRVKKEFLSSECDRLLENLRQKYARQAKLSEAAHHYIREYDWPGNWRELEGAIESAFHLCRGRMIESDDLRVDSAFRIDADKLNLRKTLNKVEKNLLLQAYSMHAGNQVQMAQVLGISRGSLQYKLNRYRLVRDDDSEQGIK